MQLDNPAQARRYAEILASLPDEDRAKSARSIVRLDRALEQQRQFDTAVAAALDRILNAPAESAGRLVKQLRTRQRPLDNRRRATKQPTPPQARRMGDFNA
jgi:hypothetical protein